MIVKCIDNSSYPELEKGKKYHAFRCVIYSYHSEVYLTDFLGYTFNSVAFNKKLKKSIDKAIEYFNKNPNMDFYDIFERRY